MRRTLATLVAFFSLATLAVTPVGAATKAPAGLPSFYNVPTFSATAPLGTVLKYQAVAYPGLVGGSAYQVMYVSENYTHKRVPVTGFVVVPTGTAPTAGWPVLNWNHGTNGMTSICAPSLNPSGEMSPQFLNAIIAKGWEFTASDYQGEGTAGLMPYLAGVSAAQDSINIVRAAHLNTVGRVKGPFKASTTYVDWGHSEGGQTAMYVAHIAKSYAPDLTLKATAAGAAPSQFFYIYSALQTSHYAYYLLMAAAGLNAWYGNKLAPLSSVLTPAAIAMLPDLSKGCSATISADVEPYITAGHFNQLVKADPYTIKEWRTLLQANDPAGFKTLDTPLLMLQGDVDEQIPVASTALLYTQMCALASGTARHSVQRWVYPNQSHSGVISRSYVDMLNWFTYQFNNDPASASSYIPVGLFGSAPSATVKDSAGAYQRQGCA